MHFGPLTVILHKSKKQMCYLGDTSDEISVTQINNSEQAVIKHEQN